MSRLASHAALFALLSCSPPSSSGDGGATPIECRNIGLPGTAKPPSLWMKLSIPDPLPAARTEHIAGYDDANDRLIVFGGRSESSHFNDVWVLEHATAAEGPPAWIPLTPTGTPPSPRRLAVAGYDPTSNRLIVFGGVDGSNKIVMDLWVLTHANGLGGTPQWTPLAMNGVPSFRSAVSGVFDPAQNRLTVFGGVVCHDTSCTANAETWTLANANGLAGTPGWTQIPASGPSPRYNHSAVLDPDGAMMVFGGERSTQFTPDPSMRSDETWILLPNASTWSQSAVSPAPPARAWHTAWLDPTSRRMGIYGGVDRANTLMLDVWLRRPKPAAPAEWVPLATGFPKPFRSAFASGYSPSRNRLVIFGGWVGRNQRTNDAWVLRNANGAASAPVASVSVVAAENTVCAGNWIWLVAEAKAASGEPIEGAVIEWTTSDPEIAEPTSDGLVKPRAAGRVTICATVDGVRGCKDLEVIANPSTAPPASGGGQGSFEIVTTSLPQGDTTSGLPYMESVDARGGVEPCTWSATGLPSGFSVVTVKNASTGKIVCDTVSLSGFPFNRPELIGNHPVTVTGKDSAGRSATRSFVLTIVE